MKRAAGTAVLLFAMGCGTQGLNFVQDQRLTITSPGDRELVTLPVTVTWEVTDFDITGPDGRSDPGAGSFGIYIDRTPQPPSQTQDWLVRNDRSCANDPRCPSPEFLRSRNIHATTETSFTIERLAAPSSQAPQRREFHEVTIVLLDGQGRRIGESAFTIEFEVDR